MVSKTPISTDGQKIIHSFNLLVAAQLQISGGGDRQKAIKAVARKEPALHALYLRASNPTSAAFR